MSYYIKKSDISAFLFHYQNFHTYCVEEGIERNVFIFSQSNQSLSQSSIFSFLMFGGSWLVSLSPNENV